MNNTATDNKSTPPAETLGTKPSRKGMGGPKTKEFYSTPVQEVINLTAPHAARILQFHITRRPGYKMLPSGLQRACEFVIEHAIGKPRQKIEHTGGIVTYGELARAADNLDRTPRPVLADVEEIANKHQPEPVTVAADNPAAAPESGDISPGNDPETGPPMAPDPKI